MTAPPENNECSAFELEGGKSKKGKTMTKEELNLLVEEVHNHPYNLGDKWYVVSQKWWKRVVDAVKQGFVEDITVLDNSAISDKVGSVYYLRPHLAEAIDYQLLPASVFNRLRDAFGLADEERDFIERVVIKKSTLVVEVYPRIVTVSLASDSSKTFDMHLDGSETMTILRNRVLTQLELTEVPIENLRFYIHNEDNYELIDSTLDNIDAYFDTAQKVVVDMKQEDGDWFIQNKKPAVPQPAVSLFGSKSTAGQYGIRERPVCATPGVCGLNNLGNTCFMASAIQCLSNVPPLTKYFVSDDYIKDINISNPLGTKGELARAYGDLMHSMWSGLHNSVQPRKLKTTIGLFAPRFSGYAQQDSQELLAYLLDGLHEDLNRIKEKPYSADDEHLEQLEEHEHATRAWTAYRSRNDSVIVDNMHGQLKSKLVCPVCAKVSIKFDPFCFLSVPLPPKERMSKQTVTVMFNSDPKKKWAKFSITISGTTTAQQAIQVMTNCLRDTNNGNSNYDDLKLVLYSVGEANDDVVVLDPHRPILSEDRDRNNANKELYAAQVEHCPLVNQIIVVKNQTSTGRVLTLPTIYTVPREQSVTKTFLKEKPLRFTTEVFRKEVPNLAAGEQSDEEMNGENQDCDEYKLFLVDGGNLVSADKFDEELVWSPISPAAVNDEYATDMICRTVVFQWKEPKDKKFRFLFYKGAGLIERECCVSQRKEIHLMDCIDLFTKVEQLGEEDSWYCPRCKKHERATKKLDLWKLPRVLVIHLKRFQYSRWNRDKIDIPVVIPVKSFELNSKLANERHEHVKYDLIAMSHHYGGLGGGHYTATALNKNTGKWYDFNDSSASERPTPPDPLNDRTPYMLVYQRKEVVPDGAHAHDAADSNIETEEMETD